jgi:hypothetical protein
MTFEELWALVPSVLSEMTAEFFRTCVEHFDHNPTSQQAACLLLCVRSVSILRALEQLLKPDTFDSWDVLMRAFMETRDLLATFRVDDEETRKHIGLWFNNKGKDTWQAKHKACETFLSGVGAVDLQLARRWGMFSSRSHPTQEASNNSAAIVASIGKPPSARPDLLVSLHEKRADYCVSLESLFINATYQLNGWVDLGFDIARMPLTAAFRTKAPSIVVPILNQINAGHGTTNPRG